MSLRLPDRWIWDFWLTRDGPDHHLFFLQADRALGDPDLRHWNVSVGHAVSVDLVDWELLPDALAPGPPGSWDDYTTWTGSVIDHDGRWGMLYTGTRRAEQGRVQRVGLASSDDLVHWHRHPENPVLCADATWYELLDPTRWYEQAWRDPWLLRHPDTGAVHALVTARTPLGPADQAGVIGHARSDDLVTWEVLPPLTEPGEFGQLEVPQVVPVGNRWYLLFSTAAPHHAAARRARLATTPTATTTATYALVADGPLGPFRALSDEPLAIGPDTLYAGKLVTGPAGEPVFLAFRDEGRDGRFAGELIDPLPVTVADDGRLVVG